MLKWGILKTSGMLISSNNSLSNELLYIKHKQITDEIRNVSGFFVSVEINNVNCNQKFSKINFYQKMSIR